MTRKPDFTVSCPLPVADYPEITMAHGGGGKLTQELVEKIFVRVFDNPELSRRHDGAVLAFDGARVAFTTDTYVVQPIEFPGGDIGTLAVNGTVNDLAMCGAVPSYLSAGFVIEEGFSIERLWRIACSIREAADRAGVTIVTGDTKVVDHGKGDGLFINTAGVGAVADGVDIGPHRVSPGDAVIVSGDLGRHGIAVMSVREGLQFETSIESDSAPLGEPVASLLSSSADVHCMRDLTRGGLAAPLIEIAEVAGVEIGIRERSIPVGDAVRGACEILGLDPLYVANEGRFVCFVAPRDADRALAALRSHAQARDAVQIGTVESSGRGLVKLDTGLGPARVVDMPSGEQLPRIC